MASVVFPGTFDPPTHGHLDIIGRASRAFEKVYVLIAINPVKEPLFSLEERKELLCELSQAFSNVEVFIWEGFVADFMKEKGISLIIRGVRGFGDFGSEFEMHLVNRSLDASIDTIWFPASLERIEVSSSVVKMLSRNKKDISAFVPALVAQHMSGKLSDKNGYP